ncbi:hypothetical protein Pint_28236 [Pistacia integerrima]|uniref:Uncharacterized protein n=1 Tax=Pistacia integerrima TaxID=434235 RepID=A0ACC0YSZ2_9ROSI|nr:hypothetical protein Pint_28236 [Pistacia integerrima]
MMLITEFMGGGNLQKYLWSVRPQCLELKLSISFALEISRAMEYLHANGIIHRDLKPSNQFSFVIDFSSLVEQLISNILLTEDKKHIKVGDFGLARAEVMDEMTCEAGTYRWMAPEIFSQDPIPIGVKKHYDHKVDVYSFAMVLWELLTNTVPFKGKESMSVAYAAAKVCPPSVEDLPEDIVPLLKSCWALDPKARPEFKEIRVFLTNYLGKIRSTEVDNIPPISKVIQIEEAEYKLNQDYTAAENKKPEKRNCYLPKFLRCFGHCISR